MEQVIEAVEEIPLDKPIEEWNIAEFIEALDPKFGERYLREKYAVVAFGKLKAYRNELKRIIDYLGKMSITPTEEEKKAAIGVPFLSMQATIVNDAQEWFNRTSLDDAGNVLLGDYLVKKQAKYATALYERNYQQLMKQ